jgi:hypothetical protein
MTDPPRVGRGVREGGQFKAQHLIAALQLPGESNYIDEATSQDVCTELFKEVAPEIGATIDNNARYGRSILFKFGNDEDCMIRVCINENSDGFRVYGKKTDEYGDPMYVTGIESTDGLDDLSCKEIMYRMAINLSNMTPSKASELAAKKEWSESGFNEEESQKWIEDYFTPSEASRWIEAGFDHQGAVAWRDDFFPDEASAWRSSGFELEDATAWNKEMFSPSQAQAWRKIVPDVSEATRWVDIFGFDPDISLEWRKQKLTPSQAEEWCVSFGPGTARTKIDAGISFDDAYEAMIAEKREVEKYYKAISETQNGVRGL